MAALSESERKAYYDTLHGDGPEISDFRADVNEATSETNKTNETDATEATKQTDATEATKQTDATEATKQTDATEATNQTDATEATNQTDESSVFGSRKGCMDQAYDEVYSLFNAVFAGFGLWFDVRRDTNRSRGIGHLQGLVSVHERRGV